MHVYVHLELSRSKENKTMEANVAIEPQDIENEEQSPLVLFENAQTVANDNALDDDFMSMGSAKEKNFSYWAIWQQQLKLGQ